MTFGLKRKKKMGEKERKKSKAEEIDKKEKNSV